MMIGEVIHSDEWESSNVWTYALADADALRSTRNPINTKIGQGVIRYRRNAAFASRHSGGAHFVFGDAHVAFTADGISPATYNQMARIRP